MSDNIVSFPTPRERCGVSMKEDMDNLLDCLMGALVGLKHSENVEESEREEDMEIMIGLVVKYFNVAGERDPVEEEE